MSLKLFEELKSDFATAIASSHYEVVANADSQSIYAAYTSLVDFVNRLKCACAFINYIVISQ